VTASKSPEPGPAPHLHSVRNADYEWSRFDSEAYFNHYYGEPHPDDDRVIHCAVEAFKRIAPPGAALDIVDVGTGPNLIPLFCALPVAQSLTVWEYSKSNLAWLEAELANDQMRPQWQHFWGVTREAYGPAWALPENPIGALKSKVNLNQGSVFEMPERRWDAATMFFCAESITANREEFEAACGSFARCVRQGGALIAAFLVRSNGYVVGDRPFPSLDLSAESITEVFARHATGLQTATIGIVERHIRSGYCGFIFLSGTAA
jgi:hypothetical protein